MAGDAVRAFTFEDKEGWEALTVQKGQVIETDLPVSEDVAAGEAICAFLVQKVLLSVTGDLLLMVKSLGSEDPGLAKKMSATFNRKRGTIHLCGGACRVMANHPLHIGSLRIYEGETYEADFVGAYAKKNFQKWLDEDIKVVGEERSGLSGPGWRGAFFRRRGGGKSCRGGKEADEPERHWRWRARRATESSWSSRCGGRPSRRHGCWRQGGNRPRDIESPACRIAAEADGSSTGWGRRSGGVAAPARCRGAGNPSIFVSRLFSLLGRREAGGRDSSPSWSGRWGPLRIRQGQEEAQDKGRGSQRGARQRRPIGGFKRRHFEHLATTVGPEGDRHSSEESRGQESGEEETSEEGCLHSAVEDPYQGCQVVQEEKERRGDLEEEEEETQEKKRRKWGVAGPGPFELSDIELSDISSGHSEGESSSDSLEMDAPLKKRSKEKPGSVLALLVEHARQQLDQTSKVSVQPAGRDNPTRGIKLSSYFSIVVRPQLGQISGPVREMHLLANGLDLLRQGDLDVLGDLLASRFMSVHQSLLDGGWSTARHLELMPMEDSTAAGNAIVLQARKHAKLAAKLNSQEYWTGSAGGRGRGGRGKGQQWGDSHWPSNNDGKSKGKKGGKGKGKQKGGWPAPSAGEGDNAQKTREKLPDK